MSHQRTHKYVCMHLKVWGGECATRSMQNVSGLPAAKACDFLCSMGVQECVCVYLCARLCVSECGQQALSAPTWPCSSRGWHFSSMLHLLCPSFCCLQVLTAHPQPPQQQSKHVQPPPGAGHTAPLPWPCPRLHCPSRPLPTPSSTALLPPARLAEQAQPQVMVAKLLPQAMVAVALQARVRVTAVTAVTVVTVAWHPGWGQQLAGARERGSCQQGGRWLRCPQCPRRLPR